MNTRNDMKKLYLHGKRGKKFIIDTGKEQVVIEISRHNSDVCTLTFLAPEHIKITRPEFAPNRKNGNV